MLDTLLQNDPLTAIIAFFVVLIPLILIHELGHFLAARAVGVTVLEFAIGFPPRIARLFTWGETEFTLNWIPLGGYVRPLGEDMIRPLDEKAVEKDREELKARQQADQQKRGYTTDAEEIVARGIRNPKSVSEAKPLERIFFLAAGAFANFLLAFVLFTLIAVTGIPEIVGGSVVVADVQPDSAFEQAGLQTGDVIIEIDGEKFEDTDDFFSRYYRATDETPITVVRGEDAERIDLMLPPAGQAQTPDESYALILGVVPDAPAGEAGIEPGDVVIAFDGRTIDGVDDFRGRTRENVGQSVTITLRRDGEVFDVTLTPRENPPEGQGAIGIVISPIFDDAGTGLSYQGGQQEALVAQAPLEAVRYGFNRVSEVVTMTVRIPSQLISGALTPDEARPVSIVGMSQIGAVVIQESIEQGRLAPILDFIAVISVALGFFNLLPIPALDGGRILFVLVEIVRGRPIAPEREGLVHLVGLALLLSLSVLVILNDVVNPVTNLLR